MDERDMRNLLNEMLEATSSAAWTKGVVENHPGATSYTGCGAGWCIMVIEIASKDHYDGVASKGCTILHLTKDISHRIANIAKEKCRA